MTNSGSYTQHAQFNNLLFSVVEEYLSDKEAHPADTQLAIHTKTKDVRLGEKSEFSQAWNLYPTDKLIRFNEEDETEEVDVDAIFDIASSCYFIR